MVMNKLMNKWLVELVDLDHYCSLTDILTLMIFFRYFYQL